MRSRSFRRALHAVALGTSAVLLMSGLSVVLDTVAAQPAAAAQSPTSCQGQVSLGNGGFEQPLVPAGSYRLFTQAQVPSWSTTDSLGQIELWSSGFQGVPAAAGSQFAELNANSSSRLYQDVATTPGQTLSWSLKHRGRNGTDVMRVVIGAPGGTLSQSGPNLSDGNRAWGSHTGTYTVPPGQTTTRFGFEAVSSAGGPASGNFLDDITFGTGPCLISTKTVTNLTRGGTSAEVGDVLRYTVTTRNGGGNPALQSVSTDVLDAGIDFVPGSIRIISGPGAGALTDLTGDDRGEYTNADRTLRVRLGDAATASAGGSIGVGATVSYSFDARVNTSAAGATVDNEARVTFRDAVAGQNRTSTTQTTLTPVASAADLSVEKTLDTTPVVAGESVMYTITVTNVGPQTGTGVVLTDSLPAGISGVQVEGADCTATGSVLTCPLADLAVGDTTSITVTGDLSPGLDPGTALTNTASVTGARTDPVIANNAATASATVTTVADVSIDKSFAPAEPVAGEPLTYTLTARNAGPSDAREVTITDPLDPETTFVSASINGAACEFDGTSVVCPVGTLPARTSAVASVSVILAPDAAAVVQNTAAITTSTSDPDPTNNASSTAFQPDVVADLAIVKIASTEVVEAGDPISFTLTATNNGPSAATDVVMIDELPDGFDIVGIDAGDSASCASTAGGVRCSWDELASGASATVRVDAIVRPDAPAGSATNTVSIAAPADDTDTTNNSSAVDVEVRQSADLRIEKTASPATGVPGTGQSFTVTVTNDGPSTARGVTISDPLPAAFAPDAADHDGCSIHSGLLQCALGDLAPAQSVQVTIGGTVAADAAGVLQNTASTSSATPDPDDANNSDTVDVPLAPSADVSVTKNTTTPEVGLGSTVEYTITVRNDGPSNADAVIVDEVPGAGLTDVEAVASVGEWSDADSRWVVGVLTPGQEATLTVTAVAAAEGTVTNAAIASSSTPDPDSNDLTATVDVLVTPVADVSVIKTSSASPVVVGGEVTYTLTVRNAGPSRAADVVVSDSLPPELIDVTPQNADCSVVDGSLACAVASFEVDEVREYRFSARIDPASGAAAVTNEASVTSSTPDPDVSNNTSSVTTPITGTPLVELVKSAGVPSDADGDGRIGAGDRVAFTFTVRNAGPTVLTSAVIDDPLLGGVVDCPPLSENALAPGDEIVCPAVDFTLRQEDIDAGSVRNQAAVTAQSPRGTATDDASVSVAIPMVNGISLTKTALPPRDADGDGRLGAGDIVDYTFTVRNSGTTTLTEVLVSDPMLGGELDCPALIGVRLTPDQTVDCGPFAYPLTQGDVDGGAVHNEASVSGTAPLGTVSDTAQADVVVDGVDAVELVKTAGAATDTTGDGRIGAGDTVPYTFTVRNIGTTTLTNASITDALLGGSIECPALEDAPLLPGGTLDCGPVPYTLTQHDIETRMVHNDAFVAATGARGEVSDQSSADVRITGVSEIALRKAAGVPVDATGDGRIGAGDIVDYTFTVRNTGTTILDSITITDSLLGGELACPSLEGVALHPGDEADCGPLPYELRQQDVDARTVHNEASVTGESVDGQATDTATADVEVRGVDEIELLKSAGRIVDANGTSRTDAGDTIAYTFAVTNTGTTTVKDLEIVDPRLPGPVTCEATELAPRRMTVCTGEPVALTQEDVDSGSIVNTATAVGTGAAGVRVQAEDTVTAPVDAQPAVALEKTGGDYADANADRRISAGDTVQFRFVVTNVGAVTLTDIMIDDPLLGGTIACDIPDLAPGESAGCGPIGHTITAAEAAATTVTNAASVRGSAGLLVVSAADSVVVSLPALAVTGGLITLLPAGVALLLTGLVIWWMGRGRRVRRAM